MSVERQLIMSSGGVQQYTISNSLRFRASASAYLNRTPASAGNQTTWTWSGWVKRGGLGAAQSVLFFADSTTSNYAGILFASDVIEFVNRPTAGINARLITTQVFRDPSAWYHIVGVWDSSNATSGDRVRLYVNGTRVTAFSTATYPSISTTSIVNTATAHEHGSYVAANGGTPAAFFDGYLAEINFIDGQALTPSSFGETSSTTGVWIPKKYTGSYGTNGFYLNFSNNTSTTALGYDTSGNGNNWTPNNFSLTTGSTYDSMIDSPTSYASGANNVGNYAVLNPLDHTASSYATLSNANLTCLGNTSTDSGAYAATISVNSGIWYWEVTRAGTGGYAYAGVTVSPLSSYANAEVAIAQHGVNYRSDGPVSIFGVNGPTLATWNTDGDVIMVALDMTNGAIYFGKNGTWLNSGVPTSGASRTGAAATWVAGAYTLAPAGGGYQSGNGGSYNFGQRPFAYTPPSGYNALNTYNLSTPSIVDGSKQFAASLYTGTGSSLSVSGANFTPDFVWIKSRSAATNHKLTDVVRGVTKALVSNSTAAETTDTNGLTAFNSNGFTVGTDTVYNNSGATYVGWQWKANGTAVTNTDGSITSSVSANTTSGFSVVTYTGNGTASTQTIGHGLGTTLSMLILKGRASSGDMNWGVSHTSIAAPNYLILNSTGQADNYGPGQGQPSIGTGNTFKVLLGTTGTTNYNTNGATYVAYCFAAIPGYSAFGSYTGNGSADGPFVYCGFRPRYVLYKRTDSAANWIVIDTSTNPYNVAINYLQPNLSSAEGSDNVFDIVSNGLKFRSSSSVQNASGGTYIYAAFAENPFKYSLAR